MSLQSDINGVRQRASGDLVIAHDYFAYTRDLWREQLVFIELQLAPSYEFHNPVTGSRLTSAGLGSLATASVDAYLPTATVQQLVATTESFLVDLVRLWVIAHPFHFRNPVDVQTIVLAPDKPAILQAMADQYVASLAYKAPRDWFKQLNGIVALGVPDDPQVDGFAELKATRDLFVHNRGIVNDTYLRKAGPLARAAIGQPLNLPDAYVHDAFRLCHQLVADVGTAAAARA